MSEKGDIADVLRVIVVGIMLIALVGAWLERLPALG